VSYVAAMEDVLNVYEQPYDPEYPQVCLDEKLVVLHADEVPPLPMQPGRIERFDYQYERIGTANLFVMVERLAGYRHVAVTAQRTALDYAHQLQWLAEVGYPHARKIRLVQDNLNTHRLSSLYLAFPPAEARRLSNRFELHFTPVHGSWLNMAEIEIGIFERQCLRRRVASLDVLQARVATLEAERNAAHATIDWRFSNSEARVRLLHLYPKLAVSDSSVSKTCSD
jgi:hypothetical protein